MISALILTIASVLYTYTVAWGYSPFIKETMIRILALLPPWFSRMRVEGLISKFISGSGCTRADCQFSS
jgi:hypothetical protein